MVEGILEDVAVEKDGFSQLVVLSLIIRFPFSTFDGTAIASAVLSDLSNRIRCRAFFSTHYHSLCQKVEDNKNVALAHMVGYLGFGFFLGVESPC